MSDPKTTHDGDQAEPELSPEEAVARANEGLADAEAAGREAVADPAEGEVVVERAEETVVTEDAVAEPAAETAATADEDVAWYDRPLEETPGAAEPDAPAERVEAAAPIAADDPAPAEETVVAPVPPTAAEPVAATDTYVAPAATAQPIFVQAPEAPRPRGNRGAAGAIGLLATLAFGALFLAVILLSSLLFGTIETGDLVDAVIATVTSWVFWTPVVAFFIGFWFLGAILNRARWGHWVIWGLLVGVVAYGGYILGALFQAPFWELTASEGRALLSAQAFTPYAIAAFVIGRELTIWFGGWVARRGRRLNELNAEAQREYERTLEAGPQLYQA
ncbi:ABC transporter [Microbacterium sp. SORGH_AS_0888]|uniref:ABC transporter n=1 Tax=Microbacterium sp. SORGH_AS_0888 TaxID=3041791 RepID=UPI00277D6127|nr:ABC transporter [Microbacterium sp. SORGH_AS_0888]MDQ1129379.1 hypothetical protein [Microbacterium sp. SORGH_AS_0888]